MMTGDNLVDFAEITSVTALIDMLIILLQNIDDELVNAYLTAEEQKAVRLTIQLYEQISTRLQDQLMDIVEQHEKENQS